MKKLVYGALFLASVGVGIVACKKEENKFGTDSKNKEEDNSIFQEKASGCQFTWNNATEYANSTPSEKICKFATIGEMHNQGMTYVYNYVVSLTNVNTTSTQTKSYAKQGCINYATSLNMNQTDFNKFNIFLSDVFNSLNANQYLDTYNSNLNFSVNQKMYIDSLTKSMELITSFGDKNGLMLCIEKIKKLELSAINKLSDSEELPILLMSSVSKSSAEYWMQNYQLWVNNTKVPMVKKPSSYWPRVGKADGKGAAAGAGAWGVGALFGGPVTWTAFGISVGSWAVGCSIYEMF